MIDPLKKPTGSRWRNSWHRYAEFLRENGRRPVHERYKERSLYVWYSNNRSKLDNGLLYKELVPSFLKLTDQEKHAFDRLLQSTKQHRNENVINHVSRLTEGVPNQKGRNEVLNADNGTEVHVGAWERRWFEMRDRYSKYLDDNKKVPTDNSDLQLYQWLLRQRKLLAAGSLKESRKAELDKLLKRGLMKAERIAKFKQLLSEAENLPRFNQFNYVDTSLKSSWRVIGGKLKSPRYNDSDKAHAGGLDSLIKIILIIG